ncbi:MAG: hypothetical protein V4677_08505 [Bacteroidota bacterium]
MKDSKTTKAKWEDISTLESIANQCIYKGKEVAEARAILRTVYGKITDYDDDENCLIEEDGVDDERKKT